MKTKIVNFLKYKYLLGELIKKGIKLKYRRSYLGIFWSMLEPLLTMLVLAFVFGSIFGNTDKLYPVYILSGRLIYGLFNSATGAALHAIRANASMIKKVYVPKYMYPLAAIFYNYVLFAISLIVLFVVMTFFHIKPTWHILEAVLPLLVLLFLSIGFGLILTTLDVFFRDIEYLYGVFMMLVMYCSAIFYTPEKIGDAKFVLKYNPIFSVIDNFRRTVVYGKGLDWASMGYASLVSVAFIVIGLFVFYRKQDKFILHI